MFDEITTPITYVIGFFTMFVAVVLIFSSKLDDNAQTYCNDAIQEFVDQSRASGYISPEAYLQMMRKINNTGNLYDVQITHKSKTVQPYVDGSNNVVPGKYVNSYNAYYKDEILEILFPNGSTGNEIYPLKNGDSLNVSISLKEPTLGARIAYFFTRKSINTIQASYTGYVGSTEENGIGG